MLYVCKNNVLYQKEGTMKNNSENQIVEWKESWHDKYLEWICGYANAQGV